MNRTIRYTSDQLEANRDMAFYEAPEMAGSGIPLEYVVTGAELQWLDFVKGKYAIYDYVMANLKWEEPEDPEDPAQVPVLTISCADELSRALDADCSGAGKACCLSDDSQLQALCFSLYRDDWDERLDEL